MVTRFAASLRTDISPQPKELDHCLTLFPIHLNFLIRLCGLMVRRWRLIGNFPILYNPPTSLGRLAGSACTTTLYPNPTAPLTPLNPKPRCPCILDWVGRVECGEHVPARARGTRGLTSRAVLGRLACAGGSRTSPAWPLGTTIILR
jgi:hypothetical protein